VALLFYDHYGGQRKHRQANRRFLDGGDWTAQYSAVWGLKG
jgi:hypothetical protein